MAAVGILSPLTRRPVMRRCGAALFLAGFLARFMTPLRLTLTLLAAMTAAALGALMRGGDLRRLARPGNGLADQLFDRRHRLVVDRCDDGDGSAA